MNIADDLRPALEEFGECVTLPSGATVLAVPGVASTQESLSGNSLVAGRTRTLRFLSCDVPDLQDGQPLTWNGKKWRVLSIQLAGNGNITRAFLGSV